MDGPLYGWQKKSHDDLLYNGYEIILFSCGIKFHYSKELGINQRSLVYF